MTVSLTDGDHEVMTASAFMATGNAALKQMSEMLPGVIERGGSLQVAQPAGALPADATHVFADGVLCKVVRVDGKAYIDAPDRRPVAELRRLGARAVTLPAFDSAEKSLAQLKRLGAVLKSDADRVFSKPANMSDDPDDSKVFQDGARKHILIGAHVLPVFQDDSPRRRQYVVADDALLRAIIEVFPTVDLDYTGLQFGRDAGEWGAGVEPWPTHSLAILAQAAAAAKPNYGALVQAWLW